MCKVDLAKRIGAFVCLLSLGSGCIPALTQNKPREPNKTAPGSYVASNAPVEAIAQGGDGTVNASQKHWSDFFADPDLKALIEVALNNNQGLNIRLQETL